MKLTTSQPQDIILSAVKSYRALIAPTYGPAGKAVLIHNNGTTSLVDDGRLAARAFERQNELENAVIDYIKEATEKTDSRVGDGTTTAGLLVSAIVEKTIGDGEYRISQGTYKAQEKELKKALPEAVKAINKLAKKISTQQELRDVAYNSYNNDALADLISKTVFDVGRDGVIAIEDSQTTDTTAEVVQGLELEKGLFSPYLAQNSTLTTPNVLVYNGKLDSFSTLANLIKAKVEAGEKKFVIIAEGFTDDVVNGCVVNMMRGMFQPLLIEAPGFGTQRTENMQDIAVVVGAKVCDPKLSEEPMFGTCTKVTATKDRTTILGGGGSQRGLGEHIRLLKEDREEASKFEKDRFDKRIAQLAGGVAVIKIGAHTENEQHTIKAKVDDAVHATQAAFRSGVVPGAGKTYTQIKTSSQLLNDVLTAPRQQLEENGAEFLDDNVVDPAEVLIAALESAVSIGCGLITMGGIITNKREEKE